MENSIATSDPIRKVFREITSNAISYSMKYEENSKLTFKITSKGKENNGVYVDIFENNPNKSRVKNFYVKDTIFVYDNGNTQNLILSCVSNISK